MKKRIKQFINIKIVPFLLFVWVYLIYLSNKKEFHLPKEIPATPFIIAAWHGELLFTPFIYKKLRNENKLRNLASEHKDGEIIAKTMSFFGIGAVRGSSRKNAAKLLIGAIRSAKAGYDLGITPDGPKGPIFSVAQGIIALSQKENLPILALNVVPTKYKLLSSWDRFLIPRFFGKIDFYASEPFYLTDMDAEEAKQLVKNKLLEKSLLNR